MKKERIVEMELTQSHIYYKYWLFNFRARPIFDQSSGLQIFMSSAYILAPNDAKNFRMKKTTSTPLMMENPVKSPIVPLIKLEPLVLFNNVKSCCVKINLDQLESRFRNFCC